MKAFSAQNTTIALETISQAKPLQETGAKLLQSIKLIQVKIKNHHLHFSLPSQLKIHFSTMIFSFRKPLRVARRMNLVIFGLFHTKLHALFGKTYKKSPYLLIGRIKQQIERTLVRGPIKTKKYRLAYHSHQNTTKQRY